MIVPQAVYSSPSTTKTRFTRWPTKSLPPPVPLRAKPLLSVDRNSAEMEMEDENIDAQLDACREFEEAQREREAIQAEEMHRTAVAEAAQEEDHHP